ncbi:YncE family protein [Polaribacter atrinae]|mgnify:CR=1 FL=1|uniref:YncE family protein n=1 Tax=Polaribacter atrinae TaxID=1333662 RepID=UPI0030F7BECE
MNKRKLSLQIASALAVVFFLNSCSSNENFDDPINPEVPTEPIAELKGFYLLNEGNMSMNKAALDYMDFETGIYEKEVFRTENPEEVGGLGDVGNDMGIYGSKLYVVVNASNKVEVLDANTRKKIKQINIDNCRYINFYKGKAYLSTYLGVIGDPNAVNGKIMEIDTTSLSVTRSVNVGRQPEELVVHNDKIYVANSGGYSPPNYESTVSVIDIASFEETKRIEVGINLHRMQMDSEGDLYVSSRGDYYETPSKLFVVDTEIDEVKTSFDLAVGNMTISDDIMYIYSTEFSFFTGEITVSYNLLDTKTETILQDSFITEDSKDLIQVPYGIEINPETKDILITDAKDYVTPGKLYCFSSEGVLKWSVETGDIPNKVVFKY